MRFHSRFDVWFLALAGIPALVDAQSPPPPSLGAAASFAVLGGSSVTSSGSTVVTGNLGVSPGNSIIGSPIVKVGATYRNDSVARQAQKDAAAAYGDLAGRTCGHDLSGQDLGGRTLSPGVYCFSSSAQLTGTLILDAAGDPNAVWVFQVRDTLTTTAGSSVLMAHGGWNGNVFWQAATGVTLNASTTFAGNVLTLASITVRNEAIVSGRLLAAGTVRLDNDDISLCCAPVTLTPETLPSATNESPYSATITASGGVAPYTFRYTGTLPAGLTFAQTSPTTATVSGTPFANGDFDICINATDANLCTTAECVPAPSVWGLVLLFFLLCGMGILLLSRGH
jgi:type VI secretion system secreted protein VgrG